MTLPSRNMHGEVRNDRAFGGKSGTDV